MDENAPMRLTLHRIQPSEELLYYVRKSSEALARRTGRRSLWRVTIECRLDPDGPRYVTRVRAAPSRGIDVISESADVFSCVRRAFNTVARHASGQAPCRLLA